MNRNTELMFGVALLIGAVVLYLVMSGELKNKSTFSKSNEGAATGLAVAAGSLHSGKKSFLNDKFGKLTKSAGGVLEDSLYALGGAYEHVNTALTPRTGAMAYSAAYAPNKTAFTKGKSPIHGGDWYKKFDPSGHLVANTHTRHPAAAGH